MRKSEETVALFKAGAGYHPNNDQHGHHGATGRRCAASLLTLGDSPLRSKPPTAGAGHRNMWVTFSHPLPPFFSGPVHNRTDSPDGRRERVRVDAQCCCCLQKNATVAVRLPLLSACA